MGKDTVAITKRPAELIRLTEEMLLYLLRGKDLTLILNAHDPERSKEFIFRGPFDGVFLTHEEIRQIQYNSEMGIMNMMEKLQKEHVHPVKSEEVPGGK